MYVFFLFFISVALCDMLKTLLKLDFVDGPHSHWPRCGLFPVSGNRVVYCKVRLQRLEITRNGLPLSLGHRGTTLAPMWKHLRLFAAPAERETPEGSEETSHEQ